MRRFARFALPLAATALVAAVAPQAAHADYIFATLEAGKVRFALLDSADSNPNPQYGSYVTGLVPRSGNKTLTLSEARDGAAYCALPAGLSPKKSVVTAEKVVGIRERGGEKYLLVYHAKGAATVEAAGTVTRVPAEVSARRAGEKLIISVRQAGKLVPESEVWVQWPGQAEASGPVKTNDKGEVEVSRPTGDALKSGFISIRAKVNEVKDGELEGQRYPLIRRWATLAFPVAE